MIEIRYEHKTRRIVDNTGRALTYSEALRIMDNTPFVPLNVAMVTLIEHDGDMEAVERFYRTGDREMKYDTYTVKTAHGHVLGEVVARSAGEALTAAKEHFGGLASSVELAS